jgi:hypothetical protein
LADFGKGAMQNAAKFADSANNPIFGTKADVKIRLCAFGCGTSTNYPSNSTG